jgi:phosphatidate cytidylyltransferase
LINELKKRINTSLILFLFIYVCVFINEYFSLVSLILVSFLGWLEFAKITRKIYLKKKKIFYKITIFLSLIYFLFLIFVCFNLITNNKFFFIYALSVCVASDIGGYLFGKTFKGKKLTKISPNKTVIGLIGSFILSLFPYAVFSLIFGNFILFNNNILDNIFLCLYLSLFCQIGDLFISYFKRLAKVKDTGKFLPGHGGILDRIDGIIFAIPSIGIFTTLF